MDQFIASTKEHFKKMCSSGKLFRANISGREIYQLYLMAFPDGTNPVFRDPSSSTHNCNNCNNFVRRYGNIVSIDSDGNLVTLFGGKNIPEPHKTVAAQLDTLIKSRSIENVFFETFGELNSLNYEKCKKNQPFFRLGIAGNHKRYTKEEVEKFGVVKMDETYEFNHLHVDLPVNFVNHSGDSIDTIMSSYRDKFNVFKRAMLEIPLDVLILAKDLINQGSLLDGATHLHSITEIIPLKEKFDSLKGSKENWLWETSYSLDTRTSKFGNVLIGEFCYSLASGEDLNKACQDFNKRVDPANYMKASAPITKKQIEEAQKFVSENGFLESFDRRIATIEDIDINEIKHISLDAKIKPVTIFDKVKPSLPDRAPLKFDGIEEIPIEKFMSEILPGCSSVEAFLTNGQENNMVTMTTTKNKSSKPIFKWANNFTWDFNGNLAGKSQIKEAVKTAGGKVDGVLRFSIMWAEDDPSDTSDLDAHCQEPKGKHIFFSNKMSSTGGNLDIDIINPASRSHKNIVENITWPNLKRMSDGTYNFWVHQFNERGSKGFKAEIEFGGQRYTYEYNKGLHQKDNVQVAEVTLKDGQFSIKHILPPGETAKEIWGLQSNAFHKVHLVCLSPNHWGVNAVGNKHYFFMLEGAKTNKEVRGFHNENLIPELLTHRKVLEVLGATNKIEPSEKQLSGLGFNSTVKDELILKLTGSFNRTIKVKF